MLQINVDLESITVGDQATLVIDTTDTEVRVELYGFSGQQVQVNIANAAAHNVIFENLQFYAHNPTKLTFLPKLHQVHVKQLNLIGSINYTGGANVEKLVANSDATQYNIPPAAKITLNQWENSDAAYIRQKLQGVNIIPGCGEFALEDPTSLKRLKAALPKVEWIAPVVAWFATDSNIGTLKIAPAVEDREEWRPEKWQVGSYNRANAYVISRDEENIVNYGGTISDSSVQEYLQWAKKFEYKVMFYPLLMVDLPQKPWRGHLTGGAADIEGFCQEYRKFILHYARLVKGQVDAFLIGSELKGLTSLATQDKQFPFVQKLIALAKEVKNILGSDVKVSYAADWSEYHTADGSLRPLDELWASSDIDFVGIDAYFPLTNTSHSNISFEDIVKGWSSGEGIDFYRTGNTLTSFKPDEKWNQWKDLAYWWYSEHWAWDEVKKQSVKTAWEPRMKPIWFTEFGFPSIDKSPNKPNVFYNPKCQDSGVPPLSNSQVDFAIQLRALHATLEVWQKQPFIANMFAWCFDSRPNKWQEQKQSARPELFYYDDHALWQYGHWLDSKIGERGMMMHANHPLTHLVSIAINLPSDQLTLGSLEAIFASWDIIAAAVTLTGNFTTSEITIKSPQFTTAATISKNYKEYRADSKTLIKEHTETVSYATIKAKKLKIISSGDIELQVATIEVERIIIMTPKIHCPAIVATKTTYTEFAGKPGLLGGQQSSGDMTTQQTIYAVTIKSKYVGIKTEYFVASAMELETDQLRLEAKEYQFTGQKVTKERSSWHKAKGWLLGSRKARQANETTAGIKGVIIIVKGEAYIIAEGEIWFEAGGIDADKLIVDANNIKLEALIGSKLQKLNAYKVNNKIALTGGNGELSVGVERVWKYHHSWRYAEHIVPAYLHGRELFVNTDQLYQKSSSLSGERGAVAIREWNVETISAREEHSHDNIRLTARLAIGARENVSSLVSGAKNVGRAIQDINDNAFALANAASAAYGVVRVGTHIAQGGLFNTGIITNLDVAASGERFARTVQAANIVDLQEIPIYGSKIPDLSVIAAEVTSSSYQANAGISDTGWQGFAAGSIDGDQLGFGYSSRWGAKEKEQVFGDEVRIVAGQGNDVLDVTYASVDSQALFETWRGASIEHIFDRARAEFEDILNPFTGVAAGDDGSQGDQQLSEADYAVQLRAAQLELYISILQARVETLTGGDKEFAQKAISELKAMQIRASSIESFQAIAKEVLIRNFQGGEVGTPRMLYDLAGITGSLIYEKTQAIFERNNIVAITKAAAGAEIQMLGGRLVKLVRATTPEELRAAAAKPFNDIVDWEKANLLPGEQKIFNLTANTIALIFGSAAVNFTKDAVGIAGKIATKVEASAVIEGIKIETSLSEALLTTGSTLEVVEGPAAWGLGPVVRGEVIEQHLGQNLPRTFPIIDKFENGVVTSIKSLDLNASTYQNPSALRSKLKEYVDSLAGFENGRIKNKIIYAEEVKARTLEIVFPNTGKATQQKLIAEAIQLAATKNIRVKVLIYKD